MPSVFIESRVGGVLLGCTQTLGAGDEARTQLWLCNWEQQPTETLVPPAAPWDPGDKTCPVFLEFYAASLRQPLVWLNSKWALLLSFFFFF